MRAQAQTDSSLRPTVVRTRALMDQLTDCLQRMGWELELEWELEWTGRAECCRTWARRAARWPLETIRHSLPCSLTLGTHREDLFNRPKWSANRVLMKIFRRSMTCTCRRSLVRRHHGDLGRRFLKMGLVTSG